MDITRLTRQTHRRDRPALRLLDQVDLVGARAHEVCGPARRRLALWVARAAQGPVLWLRSDWHPDQLHMAGVRAEIDPGRITFIDTRRRDDMLWATEEALRAGSVPLVVLDIAEPPGLTPVRRLHLAAEVSGVAPIALLVTPDEGGAPGVESRWHLSPAHGLRGEAWGLRRLRARDAPPAEWVVTRDGTGAFEMGKARVSELA